MLDTYLVWQINPPKYLEPRVTRLDWAKFHNLGYFLKAQAIFGGEIWFVVGILRV